MEIMDKLPTEIKPLIWSYLYYDKFEKANRVLQQLTIKFGDKCTSIKHIEKPTVDFIINFINKYRKVNILDIPEEFITYEICKVAVYNNARNLWPIFSQLTKISELFIWGNVMELCKCVIRGYSEIDLEYNNVMNSDNEYDKVCVGLNFIPALYWIPDKCKTLEICTMAVKSNAENMEYVPEELKDQVKEYFIPNATLSHIISQIPADNLGRRTILPPADNLVRRTILPPF